MGGGQIASRAEVAAAGQPFDAVLANGFEHAVAAGGRPELKQRPLDQLPDQAGDLSRGYGRAGAYGDGRGGGDAAGQDRDPFRDSAFMLPEQPPAPGDDRAKGAVPRRCGTAAGGQQPEPVGEPTGQFRQGQRPQPGGGQFEGQRQSVQATNDAHDVRARVVVDGETRAYGGSALSEQAYRGRPPDPLDAVIRIGQGERAQGHQRLTVDGEGFAAGGEHPKTGTAGQQPGDQMGHGVDQVLAVVDQQEGFPAAELGGEDGRLVVLRLPAGVEHRGSAPPDRREHGRRDLRRFGDGREVDEPRAVAVVVLVAAGGLQREPGLSGAAGPEDGDEAAGGEQDADPGELVVAADEAGQRRG